MLANELEIGKKYTRKTVDGIPKRFPFNQEHATFTGYTPSGWPCFKLDGPKYATINALGYEYEEV
jgi:hypothetical protein